MVEDIVFLGSVVGAGLLAAIGLVPELSSTIVKAAQQISKKDETTIEEYAPADNVPSNYLTTEGRLHEVKELKRIGKLNGQKRQKMEAILVDTVTKHERKKEFFLDQLRCKDQAKGLLRLPVHYEIAEEDEIAELHNENERLLVENRSVHNTVDDYSEDYQTKMKKDIEWMSTAKRAIGGGPSGFGGAYPGTWSDSPSWGSSAYGISPYGRPQMNDRSRIPSLEQEGGIP